MLTITKSCPYCGEVSDLHVVELVVLPAGDEPRAYRSDQFVGCGRCGALGPPGIFPDEAIMKWNNRRTS